MAPTIWHEMWTRPSPGFHQAEPNAFLTRHLDRLADGPTGRVVVPLCGASVDMDLLRTRFDEVVGIELVESAARSYFIERGVIPDEAQGESGLELSAGGVRIIVADLFDVTRAALGPVDALYDRAALVALPAAVRERYAPHLLDLLGEGVRGLLVALFWDGPTDQGPPFPVASDEVRGQWGERAALELLEDIVMDPAPPRLKGLNPRKRLWSLVTR